MRRRTIILAVLVGLVTGCGEEATKDAKKADQRVDRSAAEVIAFPDKFRNVAHKCDGYGHRVYSQSSGNSGTYPNIFVINDPRCNRE